MQLTLAGNSRPDVHARGRLLAGLLLEIAPLLSGLFLELPSRLGVSTWKAFYQDKVQKLLGNTHEFFRGSSPSSAEHQVADIRDAVDKVKLSTSSTELATIATRFLSFESQALGIPQSGGWETEKIFEGLV